MYYYIESKMFSFGLEFQDYAYRVINETLLRKKKMEHIPIEVETFFIKMGLFSVWMELFSIKMEPLDLV